MTVLRTATGKTYQCDFMGVATGYDALHIMLEIDLYEAVSVFQNPEETNTLVWYDDETGEDVRVEIGYTVFGGIFIMKGPCPVRIRLTKESS